jgi:hypothetical protein
MATVRMKSNQGEVDLGILNEADLRRMSNAAACFLALVGEAFEEGRPILADLIGEAPFRQWEHYPPDDLFDPATGVLVFYHAHSPEDRGSAEHGHFHCFVECSDSAGGALPIAKPRKRTGRRLCHIVAISVDMTGVPTQLFIPNQWVTGEWLYSADIAIDLVRRFSSVGDESPRPLRWIASLITMFEPLVGRLLLERDQQLGSEAGAGRRARNRAIEIVAESSIDIDAQLQAVDAESTRRMR